MHSNETYSSASFGGVLTGVIIEHFEGKVANGVCMNLYIFLRVCATGVFTQFFVCLICLQDSGSRAWCDEGIGRSCQGEGECPRFR